MVLVSKDFCELASCSLLLRNDFAPSSASYIEIENRKYDDILNFRT